MRFGTREYTAHVLKNFGGTNWGVVAITTFTVTDAKPPSQFDRDMQSFRAQLRYGGYVTPPGKSFRWLTGL